MAVKTAAQIAQSLIDYLQSYKPEADVSSGNVLKDVVIDAISNILEISYNDVEGIRQTYSINYANNVTEEQLDDLVANVNLTRLQATQAQGVITFRRKTVPGTTIRIGAIDGSGGVVVSTARNVDGSYYSFITSETVYLTPTTPLNPLTGFYEVDADITAALTGSASNVSAGAITVVEGVTGVDSVTNKIALTNGTDKESNADLAIRFKTAMQGRLLGTAPGYATLVEAITGVQNAIVITPGESDSLRGQNGNEVDVVILGTDNAGASQVGTFHPVDGLTLYLTETPVLDIIAVQGMTLSFIENLDFVFSPDTTGEFANSNRASDKLIWTGGSTKLFTGEQYTVNYNYNSLVTTVQDTVDLPANTLIASDVLVRQGTEVLVDISLSAAISSGVDTAYAQNQIITVLTAYINALGMGEPLEQSDLVFQLRTELSFIDNITIPFTKLCRRSIGTGVADLTATKLEYFRVDNSSFVITVV